MSWLELQHSSHLNVYGLKYHQSQQAIITVLRLISSCIGPYGKNHVIRNTCGGHMTVSSSSKRLLSAMMISRNELKVIVSAVLGHVNDYWDGGLFMTYVILRLVKSIVSTDMSHFIASSLLHQFISSINSYLLSPDCKIVVDVDFSNVHVLLAYVRSILMSKILINMQMSDCQRLCSMIVETFLGAVPSSPQERCSNGILVIGVENQHVSSSKVLEGLLLRCPDVSLSDIESEFVNLKISIETDKCGRTFSFVKTILVTCSMSGDMEEIPPSRIEATEQQFDQVDSAILKKILALCHFFEEENVGIVFCQRVIHPKLKTALRAKGIFFVDRLGSQVIPYLIDLTGKHITSFCKFSRKKRAILYIYFIWWDY